MVYEGEQQGPEVVARKLVGMAVKKLFEGRFPELERERAGDAPTSPGPTPRSCAGSPPATR